MNHYGGYNKGGMWYLIEKEDITFELILKHGYFE